MFRTTLAIAIAFLGLYGCASLSNRDPLQVTVAGIEPIQGERDGMELRLLVRLRVQNPNSAPVEFEGAYVKVEVQDRTFASGVSNVGGTLPGFSEAVVEVPVTVSMLRMVRQLIGMKDGMPVEQVRYSMSGKLGNHRFRADGEFTLRPPEPVSPAGTG